MRHATIKLYQYSELSEKAKEKAREWFLNGDIGGESVWENTLEDAKQIGLIIQSLENYRPNKGQFENSALDTAERILKEHGKCCKTYKTAQKFIKALRVSPDDRLEDAYLDIEREFLADILEDYRIMLNKDIEYQQSEEYISETMEANEYEFDEHGRRIQID